MWKTRLAALCILLVGAGVFYFVWSSQMAYSDRFHFQLGLDLSGGTHLVYRADISGISETDVESSMNALRDLIERRVNLFGVAEPIVQLEQSSIFTGGREERLIVELPGVTDVNEAVALIGKTPLLEFKLVDESKIPEDATTTIPYDVFIDTGLTGRLLTRADLQFGNSGSGQLSNEPIVSLTFNDEGAKLFADITKNNVGKTLAIFLDGTPISMPVIREEIPNGKATIVGNLDPVEARDLVRDLNFGALPVPIELVSTQTVGPSLGDVALDRGVTAGVAGFVVVALFMILWYRLPGVVATVSLCLYAAIMLALFKLIPVTLTAAGIAGFILSVGMAVDANILIFERMKEELERGKTVGEATKEGFSRAWLSIRDSNISSIITGLILFWMGGTPLIQGFALVFAIGVLVSMLTAISASRTLLIALGLAVHENRGIVRFLFGSGIKI